MHSVNQVITIINKGKWSNIETNCSLTLEKENSSDDNRYEFHAHVDISRYELALDVKALTEFLTHYKIPFNQKGCCGQPVVIDFTCTKENIKARLEEIRAEQKIERENKTSPSFVSS